MQLQLLREQRQMLLEDRLAQQIRSMRGDRPGVSVSALNSSFSSSSSVYVPFSVGLSSNPNPNPNPTQTPTPLNPSSIAPVASDEMVVDV